MAALDAEHRYAMTGGTGWLGQAHACPVEPTAIVGGGSGALQILVMARAGGPSTTSFSGLDVIEVTG